MTTPEIESSGPDVAADGSRLPRRLIFAAPAEDPRARRPVDAFVLALCIVVAMLSLWTHRTPSEFDVRVLDALAGRLPGWLSATFAFGFALGGLYSLGLLIAIAVLGTARRAVARDMALAAALAAGVAVLLAWLAGGRFPDLLPEVSSGDGSPSYPVLRLSFAFALLTVAGPYLSLPMRTVGRRLLAVMVLSAVVLSYGTISSVLGGIAVGIGCAAVVRLVFGSGVGIPSKARISDALANSGIAVADLDYLEEQPIGATLLRASAKIHALCQERLEHPLHDGALAVGINTYGPDDSLVSAVPEARMVARLVGATTLLEEAATRRAVVDEMSGRGILHFACHADYGWMGRPLESALYLTNDEPLTLQDLLSGPSLEGSRLVTLSACQTGLANLTNSPDEYVGLPAGFLLLGVPGILSSLWVVDDDSTILLMDHFYEAHVGGGLPPTESLRAAQRWLRDVTCEQLRTHGRSRRRLGAPEVALACERLRSVGDPGERPCAHPYFWAPFQLIGT